MPAPVSWLRSAPGAASAFAGPVHDDGVARRGGRAGVLRRARVPAAHAPWARPESRFTVAFEDPVAWLTARSAMSAVTDLVDGTDHVSADGAEWIHIPAAERARHAVLRLDPFHIVQWARKPWTRCRDLWNILRGQGHTKAASDVKDTRRGVLKTPRTSPASSAPTLAAINTTDNRLRRAYLLKEQLGAVFAVKGKRGRRLLTGRLAWAARCRLPEFVKLAILKGQSRNPPSKATGEPK